MRFSAITALALCSVMANAIALPAAHPQVKSVIPVPKKTTLTGQKNGETFTVVPAPVGYNTQALQKREIIIAILGVVGTAALTELTTIAVDAAKNFVQNLADWNDAREAFTSKTTDDMWAKNPDFAKFPAAVCYNKGYRLANPANVDGLVSVKFKLGSLNTDYDCQYIVGPNQFFTDSDGGFINLSYTYDGDRCSFDGATGDLSCN